MADEVKKRPWWLRKTDVGIWLTIAGEIMALIPYTAPYAPVVIKIGAVLAGVGIIHRNVKSSEK